VREGMLVWGLVYSGGDLGERDWRDLRSSLLKTWPFWRTRARGSAMAFDEVCGLFFCGGGGDVGWCCD
jgi:hypothetical protein